MKWLPPILLLLAAACGSSAPKPTISVSVFTAAPASVALGQSTQLIFAATAGARLTIDPGSTDVTGQTSLTVTPTADTTYTLTATNEGGTATRTVAVSVSASPSAAFRLTQSGTAIAGSEVGFSIAALDTLGAVNPNYRGTVQFTIDDAQGTVPVEVTFKAPDAGKISARATFKTAGTRTFIVADKSVASAQGIARVAVAPAAASRLALSGVPGFAVAGEQLATTVTAFDPYNNIATGFAGTVHFTSTDLSAKLPADVAFTSADAGSRAFALVLTTAATSTVTVSSTGPSPATATIVVVLGGGSARVTFVGLPVQVVVDTIQSVTVTMRDATGAPITNYTGTIHFTISDAQASPIPDTRFVAADLGAKAVTVQFGTAGTQTILANDTLTPSIAGSASTQVTHGAAARLALTGIPSSTVAGALLTPRVTAVDAHGNLATDFSGTVHFASTDLNATLPVDTAFGPADNGVRGFSVALATAGARSVSISQVGGPATGATANVTVANAPASRISLVAHLAQVAVDTNAVFTVTVLDRFENPARDYTGTVHFNSSDLSAPAIANVTFAPAMFATIDVTQPFATAGQQSFLASDTINAAIAGSAPIKVINGPAATYALSALPTSALAGEPLPLIITVVDAHGNPVLNYPGSATVASLDPSDRLPVAGTFVNGVRTVSLAFVAAGQHHATAIEALGTIRVDTSTVTIVSGNASTLVVASASVTAGSPASTNVVAKDIYGNVVVSYTGTVSPTSTDAQASLPAAYTFTSLDAGQHAFSLTLKTAGTWIVTAADAANSISGIATFGVAPAAATSCSVTLLSRAGTNVAVRVRVLDPFSNLASGYRNTITMTSSDAASKLPAPAVYTAADAGSRDFTAVLPTAGDQTIIATDPATPFTCQQTVTIVSGQFFAVTFSGAESWAGTSRIATVQAQDVTGAPITSYAGTILFSSSDLAASFPASVTLTGIEGGHATVNVTFNTIGLQTFTAKDSVDATKTGTAFQIVHGLVYTDAATGGKVRLILNSAASNASVVQLDLVSNTTLFNVGLPDPLNGRLLPSTARNGAFAAGMNLPLDGKKVGLDTQPLVLAPSASAILLLGASPQAIGAALANGVLYSGISQKRFDPTLSCTAPCTNDHMHGDVQVRPFPGGTSLYYSLRLRLTPGAPSGTVFDGQTLPGNTRFHAAVRDRSGSDVFSGPADFAIGKLVVN